MIGCRLGVGALLTLALSSQLAAQTSPYAAEPARTIKALSAEDVSGLLAGAGMGFARAAELNGMPGPRHALDMADGLHLSDAQHARLEDVFARMQAEARRLGALIVDSERELDARFGDGSITRDEISRRTAEIAELYGQLRAVHLAAHLETTAALEPEQVRRYAQLRGYGGADPGGAGQHHAHH